MLRVTGKAGLVALVAALLAFAGASVTWADHLEVSYYDTSHGDNVLRISNTTINDVCASIYVFDSHEELQECCSCPVTPWGLRRISVAGDLTTNPLSGSHPDTGVIEVVPTEPSAPTEFNNYTPQCNPANITYMSDLRSFIAHTSTIETLTQVSTEELSIRGLPSTQVDYLETACAHAIGGGSGHGICECGTGDPFAQIPPPGPTPTPTP